MPQAPHDVTFSAWSGQGRTIPTIRLINPLKILSMKSISIEKQHGNFVIRNQYLPPKNINVVEHLKVILYASNGTSAIESCGRTPPHPPHPTLARGTPARGTLWFCSASRWVSTCKAWGKQVPSNPFICCQDQEQWVRLAEKHGAESVIIQVHN